MSRVPRNRSRRVLVVGELNLDLIVCGLPGLPTLGQEILATDMRLVLGSSSAICAAGLARLGAQVDFLGKVGDDPYGRLVTESLQRLGVATDFVIRDPSVQTGLTISLTFPQDRALITYPGCIAALRAEEIDPSILRPFGHLHVGSYYLQEGLRPGLADLFDQAHGAGLSVSLDTGHDPAGDWDRARLTGVLDRVDIFLPNETEAQAISGQKETEPALRALARHARQVVVKCGACGAFSLQEGRLVHSPGFPVRVVDTTGAGDSFDAGFLFAYVVQEMPLPEALRVANACGALSATGLGGTAAQPTLAEVRAFLEEQGR